MSLLEHIRKTSPTVRSHMAFWGALGITLIIAGVWSTTVSVRFDDAGKEARVAETETAGSSFTKTLSGIFSDMKGQVGNSINALKKSEGEAQEGAAQPAPSKEGMATTAEPASVGMSSSTSTALSRDEEDRSASGTTAVSVFSTSSPATTAGTSTWEGEKPASTTPPEPKKTGIILIATTTSKTSE